MSTWFLVTWMVWNCPGGFFARYVPDMAKPLVCRPGKTESQMFMRYDDALTYTQDLGPYALPIISWCQTGKCWSKPTEWVLVARQK